MSMITYDAVGSPSKDENGHGAVQYKYRQPTIAQPRARSYVRCECGTLSAGNGNDGGHKSHRQHQQREAAKAAAQAAAVTCLWCRNPGSDEEPVNPDAQLCRGHLAEHEGLSLDGLDRMDAEQAADLL
jgi:hypothetical protein